MAVNDFLELMPETISVELATGYNHYNNPTFGSATTYRARVTHRTKRTTSRVTGQDVIASGEVWVAAVLSTLTVDARITLPDGSTPIILNWDIPADEDGSHHTKIYFGGVQENARRG